VVQLLYYYLFQSQSFIFFRDVLKAVSYLFIRFSQAAAARPATQYQFSKA